MKKYQTPKQLIESIISIEDIPAREAGEIGFMSRALIQANMPHKKPIDNEFTRINGNYRLSLLSPKSIGLPYGSIPRLIMVWITTEAVRKKSRELILGDSLSELMRKSGVFHVTGGRNGSITSFKDQMRRVCSTTIICMYSDENKWKTDSLKPVSSSTLFWYPKKPETAFRWESKLLLSEDFFEEIIKTPIPIDMRVLKVLRKSPMALDIYFWLTYRMSYLRRPCHIPWKLLQEQFGSDYSRLRDFKRAFSQQAKKVSVVYPSARFEIGREALILRPSPTHISKV